MIHRTLWFLTLLLLIFTSGCSDKDESNSLTEGGMKCGPGKCGASMVDGSAVLIKKKMNILRQLKEDDRRRECVLNASTTKILYACVRDKKSGRLSVKDTGDKKFIPAKEMPSDMKCAPGKCGAGM